MFTTKSLISALCCRVKQNLSCSPSKKNVYVVPDAA